MSPDLAGALVNQVRRAAAVMGGVIAGAAFSVTTASAAQTAQLDQRTACLGNDPKAAIAACTALLDWGMLDNDSKAIVYVNRGNAYDNLDEPDRALDDYDHALEIDPGNAVAHRNKGATLFRRRRLNDALVEFDAAVRLKPDYAFAHISRAEVLAAEAARTASGTERAALYERALADYDQTIKLIEMVAPDDGEAAAYKGRGFVNYMLGRADAAIEDFAKVIQLMPGAAQGFLNRGQVYASKGDQDRALEDFDQAIRLDPADPQGFYARANVNQRRGDNARAIDDYDQAIRLTPTNPWPFRDRGFAYAASGDHARAIQSYDRAIEINPAFFEAFADRGSSQFKLGQYLKAAADWDASLKLNPSAQALLYCRGVATRSGGDTHAGDADIAQALRQDPRVADQMAKTCPAPPAPTAEAMIASIARTLVERHALVDIPAKGKARREIKMSDQTYELPGGDVQAARLSSPIYAGRDEFRHQTLRTQRDHLRADHDCVRC